MKVELETSTTKTSTAKNVDTEGNTSKASSVDPPPVAPLSIETILAAWKEVRNTLAIEKKDYALKQLLDFPIEKQEGNSIIIKVNNLQMQTGIFNSTKSELYRQLKEKLSINELHIKLVENQSTDDKEVKNYKALNNKERLQIMIDNHSEIDAFIRQLDFRTV